MYVPETGVATVQVKVAVKDPELRTGPLSFVHAVALPVTVHVKVPDGVNPLFP